MNSNHIWLRAETKPFERRTPLIPAHAAQLIQQGRKVTVEVSSDRVFSTELYQAVGCEVVPAGSWEQAPEQALILGLKELPEDSKPIAHAHAFFGHAFKKQPMGLALLSRFAQGGGQLLDLEYLTLPSGQRVAAFGKWAGFVGSALGLIIWARQKTGKERLQNLEPLASAVELIHWVQEELKVVNTLPSVLVMGALGRCGNGALTLLKAVGVPAIGWDKQETLQGGPFLEILNFDLFINCVLLTSKQSPFLKMNELSLKRNLSVIADVSCDPNGPVNSLPIYMSATSMQKPTHVISKNPLLELMAIDYLPTLLPKESSIDFSEQLLPYLSRLENDLAWARAESVYQENLRALT